MTRKWVMVVVFLAMTAGADAAKAPNDTVRLHSFLGLSTTYSYESVHHNVVEPGILGFLYYDLDPALGTTINNAGNENAKKYWTWARRNRMLLLPVAVIEAAGLGVLLNREKTSGDKFYYTVAALSLAFSCTIELSFVLRSDASIKKAVKELNFTLAKRP
jgi:hypothetical protein